MTAGRTHRNDVRKWRTVVHQVSRSLVVFSGVVR